MIYGAFLRHLRRSRNLLALSIERRQGRLYATPGFMRVLRRSHRLAAVCRGHVAPYRRIA